MCTAITLQSLQREAFLGRTMDFSYEIDPHLFIVPSEYTWTNSLNDRRVYDYCSFIGIGQELDGMQGFFDGVNEYGFAAATLFFAGYAQYSLKPCKDKELVASSDFLHYILGRCTSIEDLLKVLKNVCIIGIPDPITQAIAPLHWIATDTSGRCVTIECTKKGLVVSNNYIGVMSNSPDFEWHMTNLRNYMEVSPMQTKEAKWANITLTPFGQAGGTVPLPGGYTSPERFVRTAYLKTHIPTPFDCTESITSGFHIMDNVSIPEGAVITDRETYDYTKYTAFINTNTCTYFYKTYEDIRIHTASLSQDSTPSTGMVDLGRLAS